MRSIFQTQTAEAATAQHLTLPAPEAWPAPASTASAAPKQISALSDLKRNEHCRIITMAGGEGLRSKLYNLGLHETERVKVIQNRGFGPLVIDAGDTRLILGRHMAERLWVARI